MIDWVLVVQQVLPNYWVALVERVWKLKIEITELVETKRKLFLLTEHDEYNENCREASDRVEHKLQITSNQIKIIVIFNKNWWEHKANSDSKLKRVNERKVYNNLFPDQKQLISIRPRNN